MSVQTLIHFVRFASEHKHLAAKLRRPIPFEDFQAIADERGFDLGDLTAIDIRRTLQSLLGDADKGGTEFDTIRQAFPEDSPMFFEFWSV